MPNASQGGGTLRLILGILIGAVVVYLLCPRLVEPTYPEKFEGLPKDVQTRYLSKVQTSSGGNPCSWPFYCRNVDGPPERDAIELLNEIELWVQEEPISPERKDRIVQHCIRCRDPMLTNAQGQHVCLLKDPEPCQELKSEVYAAAEAARQGPPEEKESLWQIVENEFRQFPGGRAPQ